MIRTEPPQSAAFTAAVYRIEQILGPRAHPDVAAVIDVIRDALDGQSRFIAHLARCEAAAFRRGELSQAPNQQLTYDGGLRRGARIADAQRRQE